MCKIKTCCRFPSHTYIYYLFVCCCSRDSHMPDKYLIQQEVEDVSIFYISLTNTHTHTITDSGLPCASLPLPPTFSFSALVFLSCWPNIRSSQEILLSATRPGLNCVLTHTHTQTHTETLHTPTGFFSLRRHELPVNPAAVQCRPHCFHIAGVRGSKYLCEQKKNMGSRSWTSVRTPLFRPIKYVADIYLYVRNACAQPQQQKVENNQLQSQDSHIISI